MPSGRRQHGSPEPVGRDDVPDLVCVATSRHGRLVDDWRAALDRAGIPSRLQTVTVRSRDRAPEIAYVLYVHGRHEARAAALIDDGRRSPLLPLAHLRHFRTARPPVQVDAVT
ncbi:MAG TPA: hypothetical protein VFN57_00290 [Thermomicrobiaceae bacterium]|nr:hypothetical protein [Thermomicrobiaceae bacterium]